MDTSYTRIFVSPRATIRAIVDRDPRDRVLAIVAIAGFVGALAAGMQFRSPSAFTIGTRPIPMFSPETMRKMQLAQIIASPLIAIIFLYIAGSILRWSGALFGGTAKAVEVRAALGWSRIPTILFALILIAFALIDPPAAVNASDPHAVSQLVRDWPRLALRTVLSLYGFIITLNCIAEVHRFSAWRALGAVAIEQLLIVGAGIVLATMVPIAVLFLFR